MQLAGLQIEKDKLMTKADVLASSSRDVLTLIRDRNVEVIGRELIWHYPVSDGSFLGCYIALVYEGFLCLPYNCADREELIELDQAKLLGEDALQALLDDWIPFASGLQSVLEQMIEIEKGVL